MLTFQYVFLVLDTTLLQVCEVGELADAEHQLYEHACQPFSALILAMNGLRTALADKSPAS